MKFGLNQEEIEMCPWFTKEKFIQDAQCRRPNHPAYDPTTLWLPEDEMNKLPPVM